MGNMFSISCSIDDTIRCCWDFTVRQATYTCKLDENLKELKDAVEELRAQRNDLKLEVELAEQKLLKQLNEVQLWLSRAETLITEVEELIDFGSQETDKACFASCCSTNCKSSYKLGKKVARKCKEIAILKSQGVFDKVTLGRPPAQVEVMPFQPTVGQESTFDEVWSCLIEKDVGLIGLHGLGGVGKTTLLTQINNNFDSIPDGFDVVIWVVVSKDYTIEKVQDKIGEKIGLSDNQLWVNKSSYEKCNDIFEVLSRKKFVILLDDVSEGVDLMKIGIPVPSKNGSKLVFTTRKLSICGEMEAQRIIEVKCLGSDEALKLFEEKVGHETLASDPEIPKLAKMVVAECDGLPLALVTIGRVMAYKRSPQSWRNAIAKLQQSAHEKMERVYHLLKFSYDSLDNDKTRSCLLYCSLYPEDYIILKSDLINHCIFEGFLGEFRNLSSAQYEGYDIIDSR